MVDASEASAQLHPESPLKIVVLGRTAWCWAALFLLASLINVLQFSDIQARAEARYQAFSGSRSPVRKYLLKPRYRTAMAMAEFAPGATVIVSKHGVYPNNEVKAQLSMWGNVKGFRYLDYDPEKLLAKLDITKSVLSRTPKKAHVPGGLAPYVLLGKKGAKKGNGSDNREFIIVRRGITDVIVDTALVSEDVAALKP